MKVMTHALLKETVFHETLACGLDLFLMPKKGFTKKYAVFATQYGSNDLHFVDPHTGEEREVHPGIAHFLEHKMFEQPDGSDAFAKFAQYGANANAFTNFNMTAYLFSTSEAFYPCLEHLLSYVQTPHFTQENVEKEKGIIGQEIRMYDDNPDWKVFFNALQAMYHVHPTRMDIAGTKQSIEGITQEELYLCYKTFYSPSNMALFAVGDLEMEELVSFVQKNIRTDHAFEGKIQRLQKVEPKEVVMKKVTEKMEISIPLFNLSFKDQREGTLAGRELLKQVLETELLMDILFKKGSTFHEKMYEQQWIFAPLSCDYSGYKEYGYSTISGESRCVEQVVEAIFRRLEEAKKEGISSEDFQRVRRSRLGGLVKSFDSMEYIANAWLNLFFAEISLMEFYDVLMELQVEDLQRRLEEHFLPEYAVLSLIEPMITKGDGEEKEA